MSFAFRAESKSAKEENKNGTNNYHHVQYRDQIPKQELPIPPQALGEDIEVPFISWVPLSVQLGTAAIAPPGALIFTPKEPSVLFWQEILDHSISGIFQVQ